MEYLRGSRGVAATRLHGISTWQPRRRHDSSAKYPRGESTRRRRWTPFPWARRRTRLIWPSCVLAPTGRTAVAATLRRRRSRLRRRSRHRRRAPSAPAQARRRRRRRRRWPRPRTRPTPAGPFLGPARTCVRRFLSYVRPQPRRCSSPRTIHVAAAASRPNVHVLSTASPRLVSTDYPCRGRSVSTELPCPIHGVAATPRTIHVAAAAAPRLVRGICTQQTYAWPSSVRPRRDGDASRRAASEGSSHVMAPCSLV